MDKKDNKNKLVINKLTKEEKEAGYDASYSYGNAKIHMVSPETRLGRKMTEEELKIVKHNIEEAAARMHSSIHGGSYKVTLIREEQ